jgi:acetyl esterase/lipase
MRSGLLGALAVLLLALSSTYFNRSDSSFLWKASLAATEFGHWFALAALCLLPFAKSRIPVVVLSVAIVLFMIPTLQLAAGFHRWSKEFDVEFGAPVDSERPEIAYRDLWVGGFGSTVEPKTITFSGAESAPLDLDFYSANSADRKAPWVLVIHGGGWNGGDRKQLVGLNSQLAKNGFAVASMDYRLAPQYQWPSQIEDAKTAVQYLKAHSDELGIDRDQYVVLGRSAGGQIAEVLAYQVPRDPALKGCISFYAPSDLVFAYNHASEDDLLKSPQLMRDYLGGSPLTRPEQYGSASALTHVSAGAPATLLFHGPNDPLVWFRHTERLYSKLQDAGVPSSYISIPWATHGFDYNPTGPGGLLSTHFVERFLQKIFRKQKIGESI